MTYKEFERRIDDLRTEQECSDYYGTFFPETMVNDFRRHDEIEVLINCGFYADEDDWLDCYYHNAYDYFKAACNLQSYKG